MQTRWRWRRNTCLCCCRCRRSSRGRRGDVVLIDRTVKIATVRQGGAGQVEQEGCADEKTSHRAIRTNERVRVNRRLCHVERSGANARLRRTRFRETFRLRQGLWTEDLRTPPGQECSNGSLIFFAVVLWRTFCLTNGNADESSQNKNNSLCRNR